MEKWEKELRNHNLQKAVNTELGFNLPTEEIIKGKAHPLGTKRVWSGVEYEKKPEGWIPTGKKGEGEKKESSTDSSGNIVGSDRARDQDARQSAQLAEKNKKVEEKEFTENSTIMMASTSRATYTTGEPSETTLKDLKEYGWEFSDGEFEKLKRGETVTKFSPNGMRKISLSPKEKSEKKEVKVEESKSSLSKANLKSQESKVKSIKVRLDEIGFAKHHKNFEVLDRTFKEFQQKGTILSDKVKNIELKFDFEASWYDQRTKASLTGIVGARKSDIIEQFKDEYEKERAELYKYGQTDGFLVNKLKELLSKTGVSIRGDSSSYSFTGGTVSLYLTSGELK